MLKLKKISCHYFDVLCCCLSLKDKLLVQGKINIIEDGFPLHYQYIVYTSLTTGFTKLRDQLTVMKSEDISRYKTCFSHPPVQLETFAPN